MASPSFLRSSLRPELYVCARCAFRVKNAVGNSRRWISQGWIKKTQNAEMVWQAEAAEIYAGKKKSMLTILEERGLVHTISGTRENADRRMTDRRLGAYVGIDPTAPSIHLGHLLPFMALFWMYVHGYHSVILLGGATAKIGDPTDRLKTRDKIQASVRAANMANMHYQLKNLWKNVEAYGVRHGYHTNDFGHRKDLVNNNHWWNKLPMLEVLQVLGHGMRVGPMLARDTVKNKLKNGDGMSFAEFSYPLMQGWDWWNLFKSKGVSVQIGGSDQYGNITAGIDAVKHIAKNHPDPNVRSEVEPLGEPFGFTVPLLTSSSGAKFGKTAGNAIWLDDEQTSIFEQYGYLLRTSDADVAKYLKLFTFMPISDIERLVEEHVQRPSLRKAQHALAREVMEMVHGASEAKKVEDQHKLIYNRRALEGTASTEAVHVPPQEYASLSDRPNVNLQLPRSVIEKMSMGRILYASGLAASVADGHRMATSNGTFIGGLHDRKKDVVMDDGAISWTRIKPWNIEENKRYLIDNELMMLRKGKHTIRTIQVVPDEEYEKSGKTYPGMRVPDGPMSKLDMRNQKVMHILEKKGPDRHAFSERDPELGDRKGPHKGSPSSMNWGRKQ